MCKTEECACGECVRKHKFGGDKYEEGEVRTRRVRWTKPTLVTQTEGGNIKLYVEAWTMPIQTRIIRE